MTPGNRVGSGVEPAVSSLSREVFDFDILSASPDMG
jgi:hypothetical protein